MAQGHLDDGELGDGRHRRALYKSRSRFRSDPTRSSIKVKSELGLNVSRTDFWWQPTNCSAARTMPAKLIKVAQTVYLMPEIPLGQKFTASGWRETFQAFQIELRSARTEYSTCTVKLEERRAAAYVRPSIVQLAPPSVLSGNVKIPAASSLPSLPPSFALRLFYNSAFGCVGVTEGNFMAS